MCVCVCVCVVCVFAMCAGLSHVWLFVTPWTIAYQAPLSMEFSRQEFGPGWHFLLQGIFLTQGSNPCLLCLLHWQVDSLPLIYLGSPYVCLFYVYTHTHTHTHTYGILPHSSDSEEPASRAGHSGSVAGSVRSPGEGNSFLPGEFYEQRSLTGYDSPWGHKESDTTEQLNWLSHTYIHI